MCGVILGVLLQDAKIHEQEEKEAERIHLLQLEERRRQQEAELRRVEEEKQRTLISFRKERELREKLVSSFLNRNLCAASQVKDESQLPHCYPLTPSENLPRDFLASSFTSTSTQTLSAYETLRPCLHYANANLHVVNGVCLEATAPQECKQMNDINPARPLYSLTSILGNTIQDTHSASNDPDIWLKEIKTRQSKGELYAHIGSDITSMHSHSQDKEHKSKSKKRDLSREEDDHKKAKKSHKKHSSRDCSPHTRSSSREHSRHRSRELKSRPGHRQKKHQRRSYSRERESWSS